MIQAKGFYCGGASGLTRFPNPDVLPTDYCMCAALSSDGTYLATGFNGGNRLIIWKLSNGLYLKISDPDIMPAYAMISLAFSPDDQYLFVGSNGGYNNNLYALKRDGDDFARIAFPNVPGNVNSISFSSNGEYVGLAHGASPWFSLFNIGSGDTFTKLPDPAILPGAGSPNVCAISGDATHCAVVSNASPRLIIYQRSGTTLTALAAPDILPQYTPRTCTISNDGAYLLVVDNGDGYVYKRSGDTFNIFYDHGMSQLSYVTFWAYAKTANSYLGAVYETGTRGRVFSQSGDVFTQLLNPDTLSDYPITCAISGDAARFVITFYASPYVAIYEKQEVGL